MSGAKDLSKPREGGRAQRSYASLETAWGFRVEPQQSHAGTVVSIGAMERTFWRCIQGRPGAKDSLYEKIGEG